ncbi:hypothetical protein RUM44_002486 [Polyplax serrata]|uniref:Uncharacterized protein n=1 Tax=Polyplax serrata TaxID=468196 RepID=A0ABR1AEX2_POLSC
MKNILKYQVSCRFGVSSRYLPVNEFWNSGAHGPFEAAFQEKPEICPASKNNDSVATPIQPFVVALSVLLPLLLVRVEQIMFCPRLSNKVVWVPDRRGNVAPLVGTGSQRRRTSNYPCDSYIVVLVLVGGTPFIIIYLSTTTGWIAKVTWVKSRERQEGRHPPGGEEVGATGLTNIAAVQLPGIQNIPIVTIVGAAVVIGAAVSISSDTMYAPTEDYFRKNIKNVGEFNR